MLAGQSVSHLTSYLTEELQIDLSLSSECPETAAQKNTKTNKNNLLLNKK